MAKKRVNAPRTVKPAIRKKISIAMKGNNNAEVWNEDLVESILNSMLDILEEPYEVETSKSVEEKEEEGVVVTDEKGNVFNEPKGYTKTKTAKQKRKTHLKHELLMIFKIRDAKWFSRMKVRFQNNETVTNLLGCINMSCAVNTYNDVANGATNPAVGKMNLSTHHDWSDSVKNEVKHGGKVELEAPTVPDDIRKAFEDTQNYLKNGDTE